MRFVICIPIAFIAATNAYAQDLTSTMKSEPNPPLRRLSVELRPLESLASATPGIAAGGVSVETYLGQNWGLRIGGSYVDVKLPNRITSTVNDQKNSPIIDRGFGATAGAGLRYYDNPISSGVYGGFDLDYQMAKFGWTFHDDRFRTERYGMSPSLVAGYRWVWSNGVLARAGAGAGLAHVDKQHLTTETSGANADDGERKIQNVLDQAVLAKLDLGVGMMF